MKIATLTLLLIIASTSPVEAEERARLAEPQSLESQFLRLLDLETDPAKQADALKAFISQYPKYENIAAVRARMQELYNRLSRWNESLEAGAALLARNDRDVETVRRNLRAARGLNDRALIEKWDSRLTELTAEPEESVTATSKVNTPYVAEEERDEVVASVGTPVLTSRMRASLEASMFNNAAQETDPRRRLELVQQFVSEYPDSPNVAFAGYLRFTSLRDLGEHNLAVAAAEAILTLDQTREDVLLYVAARYFNEKRELPRVAEFCRAAAVLVNTKAKPENVDEAAWAAHRQAVLFQSQWLLGLTQVSNGEWAEADKTLRATLTVTKVGDENIPGILNSLAWANYKLKRIPEAIRLYSQCASSSSVGQACKQSAAYIRNEYGLQ